MVITVMSNSREAAEGRTVNWDSQTTTGMQNFKFQFFNLEKWT